MSATESVECTAIVSRNRVTDALRTILHIAINVERRFSAVQIAELSGIKVRAVRSYMSPDEADVREPSLSAALSIAVVVGPRAVNSLLSLIGYSGAKPMADEDTQTPMQMVAAMMAPFNTIVQAASDNLFDHQERPSCRDAADQIIATIMPLSSAGDAA